jgi:hypothetical protein
VNLLNLNVLRENNRLVESSLFRPLAITLFPKLNTLCEIIVTVTDRKEAYKSHGHLIEILNIQNTFIFSRLTSTHPDEVELFQRSQISNGKSQLIYINFIIEVAEMIGRVTSRVVKKSQLLFKFDIVLEKILNDMNES